MIWPLVGRKERQLEIAHRKTHPLTVDDLQRRSLKRHVALALDRAVSSSEVSRGRLSVLDVGCGRGDTVALLRRDGWDAFGAEIDPVQADLARDSMQAIGQHRRIILDITPGGVIDATDGQFDFVLSEQVVEHVEDLETFVSETWRVLRPGGTAFHVFPSRWRLLEPHVRQPLVHWLPKGAWQSLAVKTWLSLGIEPGWSNLEGLSRNEKAMEYATYLRRHTFYRSHPEIEHAFLEKFPTLDTDVIGDTIAGMPVFSTLARPRPLRSVLQEACVRFYGTALFLAKGNQP